MNDDPDWNLYRSFLAVAQEGSLSAAARRLALTQPTLARHVDMLEARIGAGLFLRTQQGLVPTDLGRSLLPYAEHLHHMTAALLRKASEGVGAISGTVRISASEVIGVQVLPSILTTLRQQYPRLVVELVLSNEVDDLLRRAADIAVRNVRPEQKALIARKLPAAELGLHARRDYLNRRGLPLTLADLVNHDLIGFDRETPAIRALLDSFPDLHSRNFALRTDSNLAQLAAIRAGFGIGICNAALAADLVRVLATELSIPVPVWVVMHEDLKTSAPCQAVFDALVQGLGRKTP